MDNRLRQISPDKWKCLNCGEEVPTGIINLSSHWAECAGKEYMKGIYNLHEKNQLTVDNLKEYNSKFKNPQ